MQNDTQQTPFSLFWDFESFSRVSEENKSGLIARADRRIIRSNLTGLFGFAYVYIYTILHL